MLGKSGVMAAPRYGLLPRATTLADAAEQLLEQGCTRLMNDRLPAYFPNLIRDYVTLLEDPEHHVLRIDHPRELHADGEPDLGLREVLRGERKKNPRSDEIKEGRLYYDESKAVFHYNQRAMGYYAPQQELVSRHGEFFRDLAMLQGECMLLGYELAHHLDEKLPGFRFEKRMTESEHLMRLRLLHYLCDGNKPNIAQRHRDQNFLTIQVRSDAPGLWLADKRRSIIADTEETRHDSVLIFWGRKAWEITQGRVEGALHGVNDTRFNGPGARTPRHTIVAFLHASVSPEESAWALEHMEELAIPSEISNYGLQTLA